MLFVEKEPSQKRIDFTEKLKSNKILRVPGAYNPLTAKLIKKLVMMQFMCLEELWQMT